jgi:hypothetical protein
MAKEKLNLTMDPKVIEALKLQAVMEKRAVSAIIEEISWNYLKRFEDFRKVTGKPKR